MIAYLIREHGLSFEEAIAHVKQRRPQVFPNAGFIRQLKEYAEAVKKRGVKEREEGEDEGDSMEGNYSSDDN